MMQPANTGGVVLDSRAEELFHAALELPPGKRGAYLDEACEGDDRLRSEVESLLAADPGPEPDFLKPLVDLARDETAGERRFGPYRTVKLLGSGGMGAVWLAEQEEPFRRRVALKILRWMSADPRSARRFVEERRLLSRMRHSNIAQVYDAGVSESGEPYLAMEWVDGAPVTKHCDERGLAVPDRLRLFLDVCAGVTHAHRQGVIHRDLKPSNVLVADSEGGAVPKVIDFGIAKELEPAGTVLTATGHFLGTPDYTSPERMSGADADTRSDVYSLGLILYELLTGSLPFADRPGERPALELFEVARSSDAPRPSDRLTRLPDTAAVARHRSTDPQALRRTLRGDLDWIVGKALARDPDRRYEAVSDLAEDVRRYLDREPVTARPPSAAYVARRFAQRHPVAVVAAAGVLAGLVAVTALSWRHSQRLAREAATTREALDFLVGLFEVSDPSEARGNSVTAREILDRGAERIRDEVEDPRVRRELLGTMGEVYRSLGLYADAKPLVEENVRLSEETRGPDDPATLEAAHALGRLHDRLRQYDAAESVLTAVCEAWQRLDLAEDERALEATRGLAAVYRAQERYAEAESLLVRYVDARRRIGGPDDEAAMLGTVDLARTAQRRKDLDRAEALFTDALGQLRRVLGDDHPSTATTMADLADVHTRQGRFADAEQVMTESLELQRRVLGPTHDQTLITLEALSYLHFRQDEVEEAESVLREVVHGRETALGPENRATLLSKANLAAVMATQGKLAPADSLLRSVLGGFVETHGEGHSTVWNTRFTLAQLAMDLGMPEEALEQLRTSIRNGATPPISTDDGSKFAPLRGNREFDSLMVVVEARRSVSETESP